MSPASATLARWLVYESSAHAIAACSSSSSRGESARKGRSSGSAARRTECDSACSSVSSDSVGRISSGSARSMLIPTRWSASRAPKPPSGGLAPPAVARASCGLAAAAARAAASRPLSRVSRRAIAMAGPGSRAASSSHSAVSCATSSSSASAFSAGLAFFGVRWSDASLCEAWRDASFGSESSSSSPSETPHSCSSTEMAVVVSEPRPTPQPSRSSAAAAAPRRLALRDSSRRASSGFASIKRRVPVARIAYAVARSVWYLSATYRTRAGHVVAVSWTRLGGCSVPWRPPQRG